MSGDPPRPAVVSFGHFEADFQTQEIRKHGVRLRVPGQSFQILKMLLERPGELVTREKLREALWPSDTFVDFEHGLNAAVNRFREALGDSAENPCFIETLQTANNPPFVRVVKISNTSLNNPAATVPDLNLSPQALSGIDVNWRQPYVQQWNIDIQRQLSRTMLFDIGYYGNRALHLTAGVDINQPRPGAYLSAGVLAQGRLILEIASSLTT